MERPWATSCGPGPQASSLKPLLSALGLQVVVGRLLVLGERRLPGRLVARRLGALRHELVVGLLVDLLGLREVLRRDRRRGAGGRGGRRRRGGGRRRGRRGGRRRRG